jgi:ATP-dependent DNA helicase RecQ
VLRGADNERIRKFGHNRLSTYGIGLEYSHKQWLSITRQLIYRGYLYQDIAAFSVLKLTPRARSLLKDGDSIELALPRIPGTAKKKPAAATLDLDEGSVDLFENLRVLRKRLAEKLGVPPYVIFGDATLLEMSRKRPANETEFLAINGVGLVKLERHGSEFLQAIAEHQSDQHRDQNLAPCQQNDG